MTTILPEPFQTQDPPQLVVFRKHQHPSVPHVNVVLQQTWAQCRGLTELAVVHQMCQIPGREERTEIEQDRTRSNKIEQQKGNNNNNVSSLPHHHSLNHPPKPPPTFRPNFAIVPCSREVPHVRRFPTLGRTGRAPVPI